MQGRQGKADPDSCIFITLFFFFTLFPVLPLPSATCDRQAGGESSPIRLAPILC